MRYLVYFLFIFLLSCHEEVGKMEVEYLSLMEIPTGFPSFETPVNNQFNMARWALGKRLFFDPILSSDGSISCASCHDPSLSFSDDRAVSLGVKSRLGTRNSPSLANIAYHPYYTREGGVPTIEMQVLVPIQEHNEFDDNIVLISKRLNEDSTYVKSALKAYDRVPDPFVITRALACFERSLLSGESKYDMYKYQGEKSVLTEKELNGMKLFYSDRTQCASCHEGFNFTNYAFENNGLYELYTDPGRYRLTQIDKDIALFKVPSLRNVSVTAPYMHDGSMSTLKEVIAHYNQGGVTHPNKSNKIKPLNLTNGEQSDLLAFLLTLTDYKFITNPEFDQ